MTDWWLIGLCRVTATISASTWSTYSCAGERKEQRQHLLWQIPRPPVVIDFDCRLVRGLCPHLIEPGGGELDVERVERALPGHDARLVRHLPRRLFRRRRGRPALVNPRLRHHVYLEASAVPSLCLLRRFSHKKGFTAAGEGTTKGARDCQEIGVKTKSRRCSRGAGRARRGRGYFRSRTTTSRRAPSLGTGRTHCASEQQKATARSQRQKENFQTHRNFAHENGQ